jgi:hypothetical protein
MAVWTDVYLNQLIKDAEEEIVNDAPKSIYFRYSLSTTAGISVYTLPSYIRGILRITWKGTKLDPLSATELSEMTPKSVVVSEATKVESTQSKPRYYSLHPNNYRNIRFFPTPNESIVGAASDEVNGADIDTKVIISGWRNPDPTDASIALPSFVARRTRKAYALAKAFAIEGKGQDLKAAEYYEDKYQSLIQLLKSISESTFLSKKHCLQPAPYFTHSHLATPVLPARFTEL